MCDTEAVGLLYETVLFKEKCKFQLSDDMIRKAIQDMSEVYKPHPKCLSSVILRVANYDDPAHRCAYLHKYAPLHTAMVANIFMEAVLENKKLFQDILGFHCEFNLCSLGGGPGTDVLGVLWVLNHIFQHVRANATIVDCMEGWKCTFASLIKELSFSGMGYYGGMQKGTDCQRLQWQYLRSDLLGDMAPSVQQALRSANLVTMVKFISAAACVDTFSMIIGIFDCLSPGALILFIDNSGGGIYDIVNKAAVSFHMTTLYGPFMHYPYKYSSSFNTKRFQYQPCDETKLTFHLWQKPFVRDFRNQDVSLFCNHFKQIQNLPAFFATQNQNYEWEAYKDFNTGPIRQGQPARLNPNGTKIYPLPVRNFKIQNHSLLPTPLSQLQNLPVLSETQNINNYEQESYLDQPARLNPNCTKIYPLPVRNSLLPTPLSQIQNLPVFSTSQNIENYQPESYRDYTRRNHPARLHPYCTSVKSRNLRL